jgi:hypothetical protein
MDRRFRLAALFAVVLVGLAVGVISYNAGVSHGIAISAPPGAGQTVVQVPYGWYRPWGFFPFGPLFFLLFGFLLFRLFFWGGFHRRRWYYAGPYESPSTFDEWHRRAHERMKGDSADEALREKG